MSMMEKSSYSRFSRGTWNIGNGQIHDAISPSYEVCKTLNCMDDPMKILIVKENKEEDLCKNEFTIGIDKTQE